VIQFTVPGEALAFARARLGKTGMHFTPKPQRDFMATIKALAADAMGDLPLLDGPLELKALVVFPLPKSAPKRKPPTWKSTRPDASNHVKLLEDALNGIVWRDDAQVASLHVWKRYGPRAEMVVKISPLTPLDAAPAQAEQQPLFAAE
jgi:Holliday junction resolvase RusA-like endonuclease